MKKESPNNSYLKIIKQKDKRKTEKKYTITANKSTPQNNLFSRVFYWYSMYVKPS